MGKGDVWVLVVARMGRWDVGGSKCWNAMLNGWEGPSAIPWVLAVAGM